MADHGLSIGPEAGPKTGLEVGLDTGPSASPLLPPGIVRLVKVVASVHQDRQMALSSATQLRPSA